jgi:hypothetical protein
MNFNKLTEFLFCYFGWHDWDFHNNQNGGYRKCKNCFEIQHYDNVVDKFFSFSKKRYFKK